MSVKKYIQAQRDILVYIVNQNVQVGDCLPDEASLSAQIGVSSITTRRALKELAEAGIIERQQGKGTFLRKQISQGKPSAIFLYVKVVDDAGSSISWDNDLADVTARYGYRLKTISCQRGRYEPLLEELTNVVGILFSGPIDADYAKVVRATNLPFLVIGDVLASDLLPSLRALVIAHDWQGAGHDLTTYFIERGAERIALLNGGRSYAPAVHLAQGYRAALAAAGLEVREEWISWSKQGYWGIRVNEFFTRNDWHQFDAVLAEPGAFPHLHTYMLSQPGMLEKLPVGVFRLQNDFHPAHAEMVQLHFAGTLASRSVEAFADLTAGRLRNAYQQILIPVHNITASKGLNACTT